DRVPSPRRRRAVDLVVSSALRRDSLRALESNTDLQASTHVVPAPRLVGKGRKLKSFRPVAGLEILFGAFGEIPDTKLSTHIRNNSRFFRDRVVLGNWRPFCRIGRCLWLISATPPANRQCNQASNRMKSFHNPSHIQIPTISIDIV